MLYRRRMELSLLAAFVLPAAASAQEIAQRCSTISVEPTRRFCHLVAEAIDIAQPRIGLALTSGNPVPGAASTVGMRIGSVPRVTAAVRFTGVKLDVPDIRDFNGSGEIESILPALNFDASVGVLNGFDVLPTVGGLFSVDVIASVGTVPIPDDDGFDTGRITSWAAGARVGILRESFTVPGISLSAMYRHFNDLSFGDRQLVRNDSYFESTSYHVWSLRGIVGKRLLVIGASAGLGYDRYISDVAFGVSNPGVVGPARFDLNQDDFSNNRLLAFVSGQWTTLILNIAGEVGWQSGGDDFSALPVGRGGLNGGAFYGTLAVRISL